jgi:hypothetical protein
MRDDVLDELRLENPVPALLPAPPIGPLLERLDARQDANRQGLEPAPSDGSSGRPERRAAPGPGRLSFGGLVTTVAVIGAIAIAVVALATLGHRRPGNAAATHPPSSTPASRSKSSSPPASRVDAAVVALLFPHDGADWAASQQLRVFTSAVDIKAETLCLAAEDLPGPPVYPVIDEHFGLADMPNLPLIKRTLSLGATERYPGPTNPAQHLTGGTLARYNAAVTSCAATAGHAYAFIDGHTPAVLQGQWFDVIQRVERSSAVRAANRQGSQCSRSTPFPASGVEGEIGAIEAKLTRPNLAGQYAKADAIQARGARVLIRCFGADIALRSRLAAVARGHFLAAHAQGIQQLEAQANRAIPVLETKYKIRFESPDPTTR